MRWLTQGSGSFFPTRPDQATSRLSLIVSLEGAADELIPQWAESAVGDPDAHVYIRHITSRKLHRLADEGGNRLKCGKLCSRKFDKLGERPRFLADMCQNCFK